MIEPNEMAQKIAQKLLDNKAQDVMIIDISPKSSFADYFVMGSAANERQLEALKDYIEDLLEPMEIFPKSVEGKRDSGWILMDYGDVIVNIMSMEMRERYNLEKVWGDCEIIEID